MNNCPFCFSVLDDLNYKTCPFCFQELDGFLIKQESPSLLQKAQNFTTSIINHISNGMIKVSDSIKEERMNICKSCPFFNPNNTCNKCGCFLEVKTGWASEKCPEGKWLEIKTQSSGGCGCSKKT